MNHDSQTLHNIRSFVNAEKPADITPLDQLQVIWMMLSKSEDHDVYPSQQTLALKFNVDAKTVKRSQEKQVKLGWLASSQRRGKTNALSLRYQNIPAEESLRLSITQDAKNVAVRYQIALQKLGRKKFPKQWLQQQFVSAQRILNLCASDVELAAQIISHAISDQRHRRKSRMSLYHLWGRWRKIQQTYTAKLQEQERQRREAEQKQEIQQ